MKYNVNKPLVSIVITTCKRPTNLKRAIESVLLQDYKNLEIIIVDDNGLNTEFQRKTYSLVSQFSNEIKYIAHDINKNGSAARNTGIKNANGIYVAFLDDDDEYMPTKISKQINSLQNLNCEYAGCYCKTLLTSGEITNNKQTDNLALDILLGYSKLNTSTLIIKKDILEEIRGFDESFNRHQDWEIILRLYRKYKLFLASETEYLIKKNKGNISFFVNGKELIYLKSKFLNKFKKDIKNYPQKYEIYKNQWLLVSIALFSKLKYLIGIKIMLKANNYKALNQNDFKLILKSFISGFKHLIKSLLFYKFWGK